MASQWVLRIGLGVAGGLLLATSSASAAAAGPYQFFTLPPCRVVDTRNPTGPLGGPSLAGGATRSFPITGTCGIPSTAKAVVFNVAVVGPTGSGHMRMWPYNTTMPLVAAINFDAGEPAIANGAIAPLTTSPTANISVYLATGAGTNANLVLDVTGYFQ
jgi:hypothetical protein